MKKLFLLVGLVIVLSCSHAPETQEISNDSINMDTVNIENVLSTDSNLLIIDTVKIN